MKHLVDDRFDDIGAAITNNSQDIDLNIINTNQKTPKPATFISPSTQPISNLSQALDDENEEEIEWHKTDDEDQEGNTEQGLDTNQGLDTSSLYNTLQPRSGTPHIQETSATVTPIISSALSRCKSGVLKDLTESLKEIGIAKNKRKQLYDAAIQKTQQFEI